MWELIEHIEVYFYRYDKHPEQRKCASLGRNLVRTSLQLYLPASCDTRIAPIATHSRTRRYVMELCFLCKVDARFIALRMTLLLSQKVLVGPLIGIPNIRNLYRIASFASVAILRATNSDPNVDPCFQVGCMRCIAKEIQLNRVSARFWYFPGNELPVNI
jgi:hypothetical protein